MTDKTPEQYAEMLHSLFAASTPYASERVTPALVEAFNAAKAHGDSVPNAYWAEVAKAIFRAAMP